MKRNKINMICCNCGSTNVQADAYVGWNVEAQDWECAATFDKGAVCNDCGGETRIGEVPVGQEPEWVFEVTPVSDTIDYILHVAAHDIEAVKTAIGDAGVRVAEADLPFPHDETDYVLPLDAKNLARYVKEAAAHA